MHFVVICVEAFPFALQTPRTHAILELLLRLDKNFPIDLVHELDHFSSTRPSITGTVRHVTVQLASEPVQQPRSVSSDSSSHQTARDLCCTHAGWRVLRRILEDGFLRPCMTYCCAHRKDGMLAVRSEHDGPPAAELQPLADDADREATRAVVDGTSERTA